MQAEELKRTARNRWRSIFNSLGIDVGYGSHQPCPVCGGKDRFRFDDKDGDGCYYCGGCGPGDGLSLVMKVFRISLPESIQKVAEIVGYCEINHQKVKKDPTKRLNAIWTSSVPLSGGDPASKYLRNRGLLYRPDCLRFCKSCFEPDTKKNMPAMIALVKDMNGDNITIHRTYISYEGNKANIRSPKKLMPGKKKISGCAIRLFSPGEVLGVAEGIETSIACKQLLDIPTWAAISTSGVESFIPPDGIKKIIIFADRDPNYAGEKAAYSLAHKLYVQDFIVDVVVPDILGDFNDVLVNQSPKNT